jgi:hypothetical protein
LAADLLQRGGEGLPPVSSRLAMGALPALPVAKASTVSLVDVSLSTVMHENVRLLAADRHSWRNAGLTAASVKT